jgi:hypothetical protein
MISILEPTKYRSSEIGLYKVGLARARVFRTDKGIDIDELLEYRDNIRSKRMQIKCDRYICDLLLNIDTEKKKSEDWIKRILETDKRNSFMFLLGQDYALYAELQKRHSNQPKTMEYLNTAVEIFKKCGADGWVEKYEKELASLS